jgi:PAS domain S-box-containing protein
VLTVVMVLRFRQGSHPGEVGSLLAPLALGLGVLAGLRYQLVGAITATAVSLLVFFTAFVAGWGSFPEEGILFATGWVALICFFSLGASLVVGYHLRTGQLAHQRENSLRKIFSALPIGIWVRSREGQTVFINDYWASFSEQSVDQILKSGSIKPPVDLGEGWVEEVEELYASGDGKVRYRAIELTDAQGRQSSMTLLTLQLFIDHLEDFGTLSLLIDETAVRLYEQRVRESERSLRLALDNAKMGFWHEDVASRKVVCDRNWYHLMGIEQEPSLDPTEIWRERIHPADQERVAEAYSEHYKSGFDSFRIDYRIQQSDGSYIWVQDCFCATDFNEDGSPKRVMGTMQDISERKQIEIDLSYAKERAESANEAKGQFIATISHEIRTPLNAIIGLSSFLSESDLDEDQHDLAQTICTSGKSLLLLVNDILDFSKIEAGRIDLEMQEFPLRLSIEESVKLFKLKADEKGIDLSLDLEPSLPEFALGDMERLRQVIQNLLANALKFTDGGSVGVSARQVSIADLPESVRPDPEQTLGYLDGSDPDYLEVLVRDTGIGIPKDRHHVLFEAFSQVDSSATRKYKGTGLGLAICKRLVQAMGGRIWLESEAGKGSIFGFTVRVKLLRENSEERVTGAAAAKVDRIAGDHPCDILIVGPRETASPLIASCRKLGYAPHHSTDYEIRSSAFRRRRYNVLFVCMDDEKPAHELSRKIFASGYIQEPESIIGFVPAGRSVSSERCRLSRIEHIVEGDFRPETVRDALLKVFNKHD